MFDIWAPPTSVWSRWAKPVIFAQMLEAQKNKTSKFDFPSPSASQEILFEPQSETMLQIPSFQPNTAIIVNLPGAESVEAGLQLATRGYRPIPVFNCTDGPGAVVSVAGISGGLARGAALLQSTRISDNAPPAFLIDFNRNSSMMSPSAGSFDNRWIVFPQDFPSATFMRSQGVERVLVFQRTGSSAFQSATASDLYDVLQRWKQGGLEIVLNDPTSLKAFAPMSFSPLSRLRLGTFAFGMLIFSLASRRNSAGGFGRIIPDPTSGGSYG
jgi:hypothetical protein